MLPEAQAALDRARITKENEVRAIEERAQADRDLLALRIEYTKTLEAMGGPPLQVSAPLHAAPVLGRVDPSVPTPPLHPAPLAQETTKHPPGVPRDLGAPSKAQFLPQRMSFRTDWEADGIGNMLPTQRVFADYLVLTGQASETKTLLEQLQNLCKANGLPVYTNQNALKSFLRDWAVPRRGLKHTRVRLTYTVERRDRPYTIGGFTSMRLRKTLVYKVKEGMEWQNEDRTRWKTEIQRRNTYLASVNKPQFVLTPQMEAILAVTS